ncbi:MAG: phosphopentomutase [Acidobacteriota bacterium]
MKKFRRILILVLDSVGVGEMPDAARFGDEGSDTLGHVAESRPLKIPNLQRLGIGNIRPLSDIPPAHPALGNFGKAALASNGKDTTSGHWEMMGLIPERPFPTYPAGFPRSIIEQFERAIGRKTLGNYPASGTEIIRELGEEHLKTGKPIVYTSADSVFQIAAHEEVIATGELYRICETARRILQGKHQVGRVIARPFVGSPGSFVRTERRKDYAIPPHAPTVLDRLRESNVPVIAVGKIASIYCHRGIHRELKTKNNRDTALTTIQAMDEFSEGLIFSNFVDFDMLYGHRNNIEGYAQALEEFDRVLGEIMAKLDDADLLILTSDHGCDPTTASTDHSREYALLLTFSSSSPGNLDLGTRKSLADIGATVAENFGIPSPAGTSFLNGV